jgi:hypothetical protein
VGARDRAQRRLRDATHGVAQRLGDGAENGADR